MRSGGCTRTTQIGEDNGVIAGETPFTSPKNFGGLSGPKFLTWTGFPPCIGGKVSISGPREGPTVGGFLDEPPKLSQRFMDPVVRNVSRKL